METELFQVLQIVLHGLNVGNNDISFMGSLSGDTSEVE